MKWFRTLATIASAILACRSSAPYTLPAAAINTGLGLGAAAQQRASGGCYALCTAGTICNPNTGFCEREPPGMPGADQATRVPLSIDHLDARTEGTPSMTVGVSPATGRAPPPPPSGATSPEVK